MFTESEVKAQQPEDPGHGEAIAEASRVEREELEQDVRSGFESGKAQASDIDDLESSHEWLDKLDSYRPGKALEMWQELADLHEKMRADPVTGSETFFEWGLRNGVGTRKSEAKPQATNTLYPQGSIAAELEAAMAKQKRVEYAKGVHDFFKGKYPDASFAEATRSVALFFDRAGEVGLMKAVGELASQHYGLPLNDDQAALQPLKTELAQFAADPRYPRYAELKSIMAGFVREGASLHDAYQQAERVDRAVQAAENTLRSKYADYDKVKVPCLALIQKKAAKDFDDAYRQIKAKPARKPVGTKLDPSLRGDLEAQFKRARA